MKKIFVLIICFLLCACSTKEVYSEVVLDDFSPMSSQITLTMVGDALIHRKVYEDAFQNGKYNFGKMFESMRSEFYNSDLLYYNQESIIGGEKLGYSGYPTFNTPGEFGLSMVGLGFNVISRANNHTMDKGEAGVLNSCNFWNQYPNILTNGSSCTKEERDNPKIMEINGIKVTLLSYTTVTNGIKSLNDYYVNIYSDEVVKNDIEKIKNKVDVILVAMHWGEEYNDKPNEEQKRIAKYLSSLGADVIIGTHPHVIEPIEWIGETLVIYSLGNFISGQSNINSYNRLIGLLVNVDITKTEINKKVKVELSNLETELVYTYSKNGQKYQVIPFSKLNDTLLKNYKSYKIKYDSIIKFYDSNIKTK